MLVGCARVSTLDQNLDLQRDALTKAGCERIFEEKKSGKAEAKRPEFEAALAYLGSSAAGVASLCCLHRRSLYNDGSHTPPRGWLPVILNGAAHDLRLRSHAVAAHGLRTRKQLDGARAEPAARLLLRNSRL
jgi:hypothetical protein